MRRRTFRRAITQEALHAVPQTYCALRRAGDMVTGRRADMRALLRRVVAPGRVSVDVGAYQGVVTDELVRFGGPVFAYEPAARYARTLQRMFSGRAVVIHAAVSDTTGLAWLRVPRDDNALSTIEPANHLGGRTGVDTERVRLVRLDDEGLGDVGFLKIDVEGHELSVLLGAQGILEARRPAVLVEAEERHRPGAVASVRAHLERLGYEGFMVGDGRLRPITDFKPERDQHPDHAPGESLKPARRRYVGDFLFLPKRV